VVPVSPSGGAGQRRSTLSFIAVPLPLLLPFPSLPFRPPSREPLRFPLFFPPHRRIQELERTVLGTRVHLQLWDCAGGIEYEALWPVLARGIEGIVMVYNGKKAEHEKELEKLYVKFAQPARLNVTQCLIVGTDLDGEGLGPGLQGKLKRLTQVDLDLSERGVKETVPRALEAIDKLLEGCVKTRSRGAAAATGT
jgi:hypothetical protein